MNGYDVLVMEKRVKEGGCGMVWVHNKEEEEEG